MASNFVKKLDKWCDNQWIVFLCVTATVVAVLAAVFWDVMPLGSKAGVFVAFIMAFHVLEEWKFPGGLHWFYNTSVFRPKDESLYDPTRYPMSRLTDMVTNVGLQWIPLVYAALCFFLPLSNAVALCVILLCVMELFAHTAGGVATYLWYRDVLAGRSVPDRAYRRCHGNRLAVVSGVVRCHVLRVRAAYGDASQEVGSQAGAGHVRVRRCQVLHALWRLLQGGCRAVRGSR